MFEFKLAELVGVLDLAGYWERHYEKGPPKTYNPDNLLAAAMIGKEPRIEDDEQALEIQRKVLNLVTGTCQRIESEAAVDRVRRIDDALKHPFLLSYPKAAELWRALRQAIEDDVKRRYVCYVPRARAEQYLRFDQDWGDVTAIFAASAEDIRKAVECYTLGQPTASVFHLMRGFEIVVKRLAKRLRMSVSRQTTWRQLTRSMGEKIKKLDDRTEAQKEKKAEWAAVAIHLDHLGMAVRNKTMHPATTYTPHQAASVLEAARLFMTGLAKL